jgi:hypothetical protein
VSHERGEDLVALDDALTAFATVDARKAQVVELRFIGGLSVEETAETLKVSPETVRRDWKLAKVWLHRELTKEGSTDAWTGGSRCRDCITRNLTNGLTPEMRSSYTEDSMLTRMATATITMGNRMNPGPGVGGVRAQA